MHHGKEDNTSGEYENFISVSEASKRLSLSRASVIRLIDDGSIKAYRFGNVYRIEEADFRNFIEKSST
jgi:excisionase family DNA binding protein